jgi:predicted RNase H-like HicB family nuclease
MSYKFVASIIKEGKWYVAKDLLSGVTTQGKTVEQAKKNLKEAVELYFSDDQVEKVQFAKNEPIFTLLEINYVK